MVSSGVVVNGVVSGVVGPVGQEQRAGKSTAFLPSHFMTKYLLHCKKMRINVKTINERK